MDWTVVTIDHVQAACNQYDAGARPKRPAQSTFLLFNGNRYPAKFIRGLAYRIATGVELDPSNDYAGGMETVRFFSKLGLTTEHKGQNHGPSSTAPTATPPARSTSKSATRPRQLPPEKQSLFNLLASRYGEVELEKSFPWLGVPHPDSLDGILRSIFQSLQAYRGFSDFITTGIELKCDFVLPTERIIIEYDERQHFTEPRAIALDHYPPGLQLGFDVQLWANECRRVKAVDSLPPHRDEQRAFYDTLRDILAGQNGYAIIRLRDEDYEWTSSDAGKILDEIVASHNPRKDQAMPEPSSSDKEILLSYMRRSKDNWYWEEPIEDILQTSNRSLINPIGKKIRKIAAKRWREDQFTDAEVDRMVLLIRSEVERIGDVEPPPNLVPTITTINDEVLRRLHSAPTIKKIALVSHDYTIRGNDGLFGYAEHYAEIARRCDDDGCDTILFALYSWDGRSAVARTHGTLFAELLNVRVVIFEAGDLEAHSGQPAPDDLGIEVWLNDGGQPIVVRQQFATTPGTGLARQYINELPCRKTGSALLVVCGESSVMSADSFGVQAALDKLDIQLVMNPVHTYMRPRGSNDYHRKRLSMFSESNRTAVSVWNQGRYRTEPDPWLAFHDGVERSEIIEEVQMPVHARNVRLGMIDVSALNG